MQEVTASRDLSPKSMTFNIDEINKLFRKKGYYMAMIFHKDDAIKQGSKSDDLMRAKVERGKCLNELVSDVLKINAMNIVWNSNDTVKIDYLEK